MTEDAGNHYRVATLNNVCRVIPKLLGQMSWTVLRLHYQGRTVALLPQEGVLGKRFSFVFVQKQMM